MPYSLLVAFVDLRYWDVHKVSLHPFSFPTKKKSITGLPRSQRRKGREE